MKIAKISIHNVLGITELEHTPAGFNEISGRNGSGKTSVLTALKAALQSGHDATLLRKGAERGEVVLVLDDGAQITKTITPGATTLTVRRDGKKVARPAEVLQAITDMLSVNPVDFLRAPKKDRVRVLLEAMPLEADLARISQLAGIDVPVSAGTHALDAIKWAHKQVFDARTGTNRAVDEKKKTIAQLEQAVPPLPTGATADEHVIEEQIRAEVDAKDVLLGKINTKIDEMRRKAQEDIDAIRAKAQEDIDQVKAQLEDAEKRAAAARTKRIDQAAETCAPLNASLTIIRADREAAGRRKQTLETITTLELELGALSDEATNQTHALAALEAYKSELLANMPIPGLEVIDGEIYREGVQFDRLNTAQQVDVAVELAKLRAGELGVICVDGIELLDSTSYEEFRDRCLQSDLQMFVTRVGEGDFSIESADT